MTKLRKQRKRKVYRYKVNRKRLRNKIYSVGKVTCKDVKEAWESKKSVKTNLKEMGLAYDPNEAIAVPNFKENYKNKLKGHNDTWIEEDIKDNPLPSKSYVVDQLEKESKAPREKLLRLPNSQVEWISYLLDKYKTDYIAMSKDPRNYYQETWKQIRAKIRLFKKIPEQYNAYLQERGLSDSDLQEKEIEEEEE